MYHQLVVLPRPVIAELPSAIPPRVEGSEVQTLQAAALAQALAEADRQPRAELGNQPALSTTITTA